MCCARSQRISHQQPACIGSMSKASCSAQKMEHKDLESMSLTVGDLSHREDMTTECSEISKFCVHALRVLADLQERNKSDWHTLRNQRRGHWPQVLSGQSFLTRRHCGKKQRSDMLQCVSYEDDGVVIDKKTQRTKKPLGNYSTKQHNISGASTNALLPWSTSTASLSQSST